MPCLPKKRNDLATIWRCLPLAVYYLGFATLQTGYPIFTLILQAQAPSTRSASAVLSYIFNAIQIVFGLIAICSLLVRWLPGIKLYEGALLYLVLTWAIYVAVIIVVIAKDKTSTLGVKSQTTMVVILVISIGVALVLCTLAYFLRSCLASLIMIIESGGHGFESLNYKQLKTGVCRRAFTQADNDVETLSDFDSEP